MHGVIYVEDSANSKLSKGSAKIDSTYASIKATCPDSCELKTSKTCYAMSSFSGMTVRRLDKRARSYSPLKLAQAEARAIDDAYRGNKIPKGRCLRIHTAGDSRTIKGTRLIANAIKRWLKRGGTTAFTYTHAWRHVPRTAWGPVNVLASIESIDQVETARKQGYPSALVVSEHPSEKAFQLDGCSTKWIPCPAQTKPGGKEIGCVDCRLCFNTTRLFEGNFGIAFAAHGVKQNKLKRHLKVLK